MCIFFLIEFFYFFEAYISDLFSVHCSYHAMCIHGDKSQEERDYVLKQFRGGNAPMLVATDVAARGLGE